jgi:hypothetical protein
MNSSTFVLFAVILVAGIQAGYSLHCFVCNSGSSYDGEVCADPFDEDKAREANLLKDCSQLPEDLGGPKKNYTMCRKYVQQVQSGEDSFRIIRSCATAGRPGECIDRTGTASIKLQYCECDNEDPQKPCNAATRAATTFGFLTLVLAAVLPLLS